MILPGFQHPPGVDCGSTALADALRARGLDLSEAMVFGLGAAVPAPVAELAGGITRDERRFYEEVAALAP